MRCQRQGRPLFPTAEVRETLVFNVFCKNPSQAGKGWQEAPLMGLGPKPCPVRPRRRRRVGKEDPGTRTSGTAGRAPQNAVGTRGAVRTHRARGTKRTAAPSNTTRNAGQTTAPKSESGVLGACRTRRRPQRTRRVLGLGPRPPARPPGPAEQRAPCRDVAGVPGPLQVAPGRPVLGLQCVCAVLRIPAIVILSSANLFSPDESGAAGNGDAIGLELARRASAGETRHVTCIRTPRRL